MKILTTTLIVKEKKGGEKGKLIKNLKSLLVLLSFNKHKSFKICTSSLEF